MRRSIRNLALFLLGALLLSSCSMLTAQGRRERAYSHYVAKCSHNRVKQQRKMGWLRSRIPTQDPSDAVVSTSVSGPESVTSSNAGAGY
jgi:hypothetical protein